LRSLACDGRIEVAGRQDHLRSGIDEPLSHGRSLRRLAVGIADVGSIFHLLVHASGGVISSTPSCSPERRTIGTAK
jgi:hypothetical protein